MANEIEAYTNFLFYNSEDGKTSIQVIADADAEGGNGQTGDILIGLEGDGEEAIEQRGEQ